MPTCFIRCLECGETFSSPIGFGNAEAFFTCSLVGNTVDCPQCGKSTGCNKENMVFRAEGEGFVGADA